jgi:predicted DNA-binding transcriptional regulator AlpA
MSESAGNTQVQDSGLIVTLQVGQFRELVRQEVQAALSNGHDLGERLLDADEAAQLLGVSTDFLYRNAKKLPFTRKLAPKLLRFSYQGILKWLATRKPN